MKFNLSVFDIYSKTMVVESAVVDFKGLVAILGHLGGIRDITITDDYSVLKNTHGVSITSRRTIGPSYRFDISLVKDEQVEEVSEPTIKTVQPYYGRHIPYELTVFDDSRNVHMVHEQLVDDTVVVFALQTFLELDRESVSIFMSEVNKAPWLLSSMKSQNPELKPFVVTVTRKG